MRETLSLQGIQPARLVIPKKPITLPSTELLNKWGTMESKGKVWRCGWGTHDGRGCQQTLAYACVFRSRVDEYTGQYFHACALLEIGYEQRPEGHRDAGVFFFSKRPYERTYFAKKSLDAHSELYGIEAAEYDTHLEETKTAIKFYADHGQEPPPRLIESLKDFERIKEDEAARLNEDRRLELAERCPMPWCLVQRDQVPVFNTDELTGLVPWEKYLPATIRCKVCSKLSRILTTGVAA